MRKILFRAKRVDGGWAVGDYLAEDTERAKAGISWILPEGENEETQVYTSTVGQFTGLSDKNGKKIFEGDIIRYSQKNCEIWWNDEAFQWQAKATQRYPYRTYHGGYLYDNWDNVELAWIAAEIAIIGEISTEVIGNIHDNPELMKEEEHGETH